MISLAASVLQAIGNTPLVRLTRVLPRGSADVLVKLESLNLRVPSILLVTCRDPGPQEI